MNKNLPKDVKKIDELRVKHNTELIKRMRAGDDLQKFDAESSWYPTRKKIEKDPKAIKRLFEGTESKKNPEAS